MYEKPMRSALPTHFFSKGWKAIALALAGLALIVTSLITFLPNHSAAHAEAAGDWTTYMDNIERSGYNASETAINQASATNLQFDWTSHTGGAIFSQPVVANGMVYWGSFDGNEYASDLTGHQIWSKTLGGKVTQCAPVNPLGIVSSAAVVNGVVYVGGTDHNLYALNALTGAVIWHTSLGVPLNAPPTNTYIWDSPLVVNNSVYIGVATTGESAGCKLVPGAFYQLDVSTGAIQNTLNTVPTGQTPACLGGGIWASPTYDPSDGSIYISAGTQGNCNEPYAIGLVKINASNLSVLGSWSVPLNNRVKDSDFGATPTLFTANGQNMVGLVNKNGTYYAFNRTGFPGTGPAWTASIAVGGACPQCNNGSISSSAWDGHTLYVAGGTTNINTATCNGSVRALDPTNGHFLWQACLAKTVMGAVTVVPGVVAVLAGPEVVLLNASSGTTLFTYKNNANTYFYGSPSISNGVLYAGNLDGNLYAFGPGQTKPAQGPVSANWYFAEGKVGEGFTEFLTIENPDPVNTCTVTLDYLLTSGNPVTKTVTVNPATRFTESVNSDLNIAQNSSISQSVSTIATATTGQGIGCKGVVAERPMYFTNFLGINSGSDVLGATHTAQNFTFADVSTATGHTTFVTVLNPPGGQPANITATYFVGGAQLGTQKLTVQPGNRGTLISTNYGKDVAATITSDQPVVVERPTYFSKIVEGNAGMVWGAASVVGAEKLTNDWLFAEGYTGSGFEEHLVVANPGADTTGNLLLEYTNGTVVTVPFTVKAQDLAVFDVNQLTANPTGSGATCNVNPCTTTTSVSAEIKTASNVVAEREMFFRYNGGAYTALGGTDITGQGGPAAATAYSFAEGDTYNGFNEWLTLQNPTTKAEDITLTLVNEDGHSYTVVVTVNPQSRSTVNITSTVAQHLIVPGDTTRGYYVSMSVSSSAPFVAERPMYWNFSGFQGGSDILGYIGN